MGVDYSALYQILPGLAVLVIIESIEMMREHRFAKDRGGMFASVYLGIGAIIINCMVKTSVFFVYDWVYQFRLLTLPADAWWVWMICFFGDDLSYYWFHRCSHHVRFFWASHSVHHSAEVYTLTTAFRLPWTSSITGNFLFWTWMPLIGFNPWMIIALKSFSAVYQLWLHTEKIKRLPKWLEAIFNTPSHHRVHHGSDTDYLDKNLGGTLVIWDRLFGTYREETHKPTYGLTKNIRSDNPVVIAFSEWGRLAKDLKNARTARECIYFLLKSPGWTNSIKSAAAASPAGNKRAAATDTVVAFRP